MLVVRGPAISIISQRRNRLNYQHGCVQTGAQLITLGWSPCCLCPRSATSQLTTWRFIGANGSTRGNNSKKTFILCAAISHLECAVRGRSNGPNSFHSEMHNAGAASGRDAALRFSSPPPNDYCFFHIRQSVRSSRGCSNMLGCPFFSSFARSVLASASLLAPPDESWCKNKAINRNYPSPFTFR